MSYGSCKVETTFFVFPGYHAYAFDFFELFLFGHSRVASKLAKPTMYRCVTPSRDSDMSHNSQNVVFGHFEGPTTVLAV